VIESGEAKFTVDGQEINARAGQIVVAPANKPHRFMSTGTTTLHAINIVPSDKMTFTWLENEPANPVR
jgi:mannose-6-phosphate isomerase-like protein (cupin superfamily)